jgi:iron complex outermembrane receptor protein
VGFWDEVSTAEDKANFSLNWSLNDWSIHYLAEYISGQKGEAFFIPGYFQQIPSLLYHDIVASYTFDGFGGNAKITAGVTNLTNEAPPFADLAANSKTDVSTYRLFGIGYYLRIQFDF